MCHVVFRCVSTLSIQKYPDVCEQRLQTHFIFVIDQSEILPPFEKTTKTIIQIYDLGKNMKTHISQIIKKLVYMSNNFRIAI